MRVQCIANDVKELPDSPLRKRLLESIHREGPDEDLVIGHSYLVFAVGRWSDGGLRVYLHTIEESDHPYPYPLEMFDLTDPALPANWCVSFEQQKIGLTIKRISFLEWANDDHFYERLVDGDKTTIAIYRRQRSNLDATA